MLVNTDFTFRAASLLFRHYYSCSGGKTHEQATETQQKIKLYALMFYLLLDMTTDSSTSCCTLSQGWIFFLLAATYFIYAFGVNSVVLSFLFLSCAANTRDRGWFARTGRLYLYQSDSTGSRELHVCVIYLPDVTWSMKIFPHAELN